MNHFMFNGIKKEKAFPEIQLIHLDPILILDSPITGTWMGRWYRFLKDVDPVCAAVLELPVKPERNTKPRSVFIFFLLMSDATFGHFSKTFLLGLPSFLKKGTKFHWPFSLVNASLSGNIFIRLTISITSDFTSEKFPLSSLINWSSNEILLSIPG